ncbi:hypothetical protein FQR65_LT10433 [Abscondita terminalis]|nr:hypothetical protein FQR65_LT10433 [Abscondita terminalis]
MHHAVLPYDDNKIQNGQNNVNKDNNDDNDEIDNPGAGSGIGRSTCFALAREGASVVATDKNLKAAEETVAQLNSKTNNDHLCAYINVAESKSVKAVLQEVLAKYKKPPSIIANCAGITRDNFLLKMSEDDFDEVLNVNLKGTFLVMKSFAQAIVDNGIQEGSIINISSIVAKNGNIGQCNYAASKAGVELLTKTAAKEFGKFGIRCNAILPGFINTPIVNTIPPDLMKKFVSNIICNRIGQPEDVAELITFLACERSSFINGSCIEITGGLLSL